jgi:hypothetical protein
MHAPIILFGASYLLSRRPNFVGAIPRTLSHRQLLGDPDHPFLFDPSPDNAQSADAPRSISECRDINLQGSTLSVTCLKESTQTATTLAVNLDTCIANVNGLLTYNAAYGTVYSQHFVELS